jgi:hypothetical protein
MLLFTCRGFACDLIGVVFHCGVLRALYTHTCVFVGFITNTHSCTPSLLVHSTFDVTPSKGSAYISRELSQSVYTAVHRNLALTRHQVCATIRASQMPLSTLMHQYEGSAVFRRGAKTDGQGEIANGRKSKADVSAGQSEDMSGSSTEKSTLKMR